jgi:hypothetical protein
MKLGGWLRSLGSQSTTTNGCPRSLQLRTWDTTNLSSGDNSTITERMSLYPSAEMSKHWQSVNQTDIIPVAERQGD